MKIIKHINNLFIIDTGAEIKEGDTILDQGNMGIVICNVKSNIGINVSGSSAYYSINSFDKILYQQKEELPNIPPFQLPNQVVDVEKVANDFCKEIQDAGALIKEDFEQCKSYYKSGYSQCLTNNKDKLYTKEQIKEAICEAWNTYEDNEEQEPFTKVMERILQSISTPDLSKYDGKEVKVESCFMCDARGCIETDCKSCNGTGNKLIDGKIQIKIL